MPTIPKLDVLLYLIAWDKSKTILNCRLFAFALKMIFNLILKLNLKMNSNSKLVLHLILNLIFNLVFNLKMFRLWRACASRETWKWVHKKPIYGQKIVPLQFSFVKNFFQKNFWRICRPSPKKRLPEGSLAELMKIVLCSGRLCCGWWLTLRVSRPFAFALSRARGHFLR